MNQTNLYLCGDIGGTYSRLKLYMNTSKNVENYEILYSRKYLNSDYEQFDEILTHFMEEANMEAYPPISLACAGPVINDSVRFTNISWTIDKQYLEKTYFTSVCLINDFEACGYGIQLLKEDETITLNKGLKQENDVKCCIGPGTGLGQCFMINTQCFPSEGGHTLFSPQTKLESELQEFIRRKYRKNVVIENIVSGTGIVNIYEFLSYKYPENVDSKLHQRLQQTTEKAKLISSSSNMLCIKAMELFFKHYGNEVRNCCLKWLPYGGCYITGGLTPKFIKRLQDPDQIFMKTLLQDNLKDIIKKTPIHGILIDDLGERGAYMKAFQETV